MCLGGGGGLGINSGLPVGMSTKKLEGSNVASRRVHSFNVPFPGQSGLYQIYHLMGSQVGLSLSSSFYPS